MGALLEQAVQTAIAELPKRNIFKRGNATFRLRVLYPANSWKQHNHPLSKPGSLEIGEDSCGNTFLCDPDGSVLFWDHEIEEGLSLAPSVAEFLDALVEPTPVELKPGQVTKVWIDPAFLEEQRRKGNIRS